MRTYVSINRKLKSALSPILPTAHGDYGGKDDAYAVFRVSARTKSVIGSGENQAVVCYGFVDVFTKTNSSVENSVLFKIDKALEENGFMVANITDPEYIYDKHYFHAEVTFRYVYPLEV